MKSPVLFERGVLPKMSNSHWRRFKLVQTIAAEYIDCNPHKDPTDPETLRPLKDFLELELTEHEELTSCLHVLDAKLSTLVGKEKQQQRKRKRK